jgi:hypothetical protein
MKIITSQLLKWEQLHLCLDAKILRQPKTGDPVKDDILSRVVHWSYGPENFKNVVRKFIKASQRNFPLSLPFSILELNILKWYVGQWVGAMPEQPYHWDEKLDEVKNARELLIFYGTVCKPKNIEPF